MSKKNGVYGVGTCDAGRHVASVGTKPTHGYKLWQRMLQRCYDPKYLERRPTYIGCEVHDAFLRFQQFMDWAEEQTGYGHATWALDKDLIVKGNRVYGPNTCVFIPPQINQLINLVKGKRTDLPIGVFTDKRDGMYYSSLKVGEYNRLKRLGTFRSISDAFAAYKTAKEVKAKSLAIRFKGLVDDRVYEALMKYEVRIDD